MSGELALAIIAEHVTMDTPLSDIVTRLGATDRANLAPEVLAVRQAVFALQDIVCPRKPKPDRNRRSVPVVKQKVPEGKSIRNRYKGNCECGRHVAAGDGRAVVIDGKWTTFCYVCAVEKGHTESQWPPSPMTGEKCPHGLDMGLCEDPDTHYPYEP